MKTETNVSRVHEVDYAELKQALGLRETEVVTKVTVGKDGGLLVATQETPED